MLRSFEERDWNPFWESDTIVIKWDHGCTKLVISDHIIAFTISTGSLYYHVEITNKSEWITAKLDPFYSKVEDEHKKYRYRQEGINSLEDWLQFIIRAYVDLALNYQKSNPAITKESTISKT